jgi:hypothetical protein
VVTYSAVYVTARGTDNGLHLNIFDRVTSQWQGWRAIGGATAVAGTPAISSHAPDYAEVFDKNTSAAPYHRVVW